MDEHLTNIIERAILDYQNDGDKAREQHLMECLVSQAVTAAGYRFDPYPNGKTKGQLIARIEELEVERDKTRNLLIGEHEWLIKATIATESDTMAEAMEIHKRRNPNCPVCAFLAKTSTVHG